MPRKINHNNNIRSRAIVKIKDVVPGNIVEFRYTIESSFDEKPLVFVLFEKKKAKGRKQMTTKLSSQSSLLGLNLNYLSNYEIEMLFKEEDFRRLRYYNLYKKAFRTYKIKEIQSIRLIDYETPSQKRQRLEEEREN